MRQRRTAALNVSTCVCTVAAQMVATAINVVDVPVCVQRTAMSRPNAETLGRTVAQFRGM